MRVNVSNSGMLMRVSGPMMSCTSPPGAEIAAGAVDHDDADVFVVDQIAKQIAQLGIRIERQRILALGNIERDEPDALLHAPQKVPGLVVRQLALSE